jgi:hypothetical protein
MNWFLLYSVHGTVKGFARCLRKSLAIDESICK